MTQPEDERTEERLVMDYPVTLTRLPDALRRDEEEPDES